MTKYECNFCWHVSNYDRNEDKILEVCWACGNLVWLHKI